MIIGIVHLYGQKRPGPHMEGKKRVPYATGFEFRQHRLVKMQTGRGRGNGSGARSVDRLVALRIQSLIGTAHVGRQGHMPPTLENWPEVTGFIRVDKEELTFPSQDAQALAALEQNCGSVFRAL